MLSTVVSEREVKELESSFGQLNAMAGHGRLQQMSFETFSTVALPVLPSVLIDGFFEAFDANRDGRSMCSWERRRRKGCFARMHRFQRIRLWSQCRLPRSTIRTV